MTVVSNTSPINYLVQIGHVELLQLRFGQVVITSATVDELSQQSTSPCVHKFVTAPSHWIAIRRPNAIDPSLRQFGAGEQEAISLALELKADLLIIDDKSARRAAGRLGLAVTGTLGILKQAAARKRVDLSKALVDLRSCGFYMSDELVDNLLEARPDNSHAGGKSNA